VVSFSHASVLTASHVATDAQISRNRIEEYLEILEDLLRGWRVPVFTRPVKRTNAADPKLFRFDAGKQ
jgi:hypothetical protein